MLEASSLAKFYGERLVFKGVSLRLEAGRTLMVVGANGAGKTTLLRVLAGLSRPSAGSVRSGVERGRMAYLGHQTFIYPDATASENLRFWTGLYGRDLDDAALQDALERVGLRRFAQERAGAFSRGMAQRLNLARVFCIGPSLLFLDEPDTGLDVASTAMLHDRVEALRRDGAAVAWVSHHLARDLAKADDVLFLDKGRAAYLGPASGFDASDLSGAECAC
uniref:Heme ABC exporter ATP-binding protein CcmA n=1 Tax=Fundidesulfovibrio putealis TaxID=270496 RepID=A0A7C4AI62_9BACT